MSLVINLARFGAKKLPFYRIVVKENRSKRDGKFIEILGTHDRVSNTGKETITNIKEERVKHWIEAGAKPSKSVADIIEKAIPGYYKAKQEERKAKLKEKRAKRAAKAK